MLLKTKNLKSIINLKKLFILSITLLTVNVAVAQEIIPEPLTETAQDSVKSNFDATKVDGVAAVVGNYIILDSDLDKKSTNN